MSYYQVRNSTLDPLQRFPCGKFRFAENYQSQNGDVLTDDTSFVTNPVNAYLLIKRLTSDWKYIKQLMSANNADRFIRNITQGRLENSVWDLKGIRS